MRIEIAERGGATERKAQGVPVQLRAQRLDQGQHPSW